MDLKFGHQIFRWHLEVSSKCALACPRCPRTGAENKQKYVVTEHSLELIKSIFTKAILQQTQRIVLCGGQGDPIYNQNLLEIVKYIKTANPTTLIAIVTNGSYRPKEWWQELSEALNEYDCVVFSVDGWDQESNSKYRVNSNFDSIMDGIKTMVNGRSLVTWSTIVFRFNQQHIKRIEDLARELGVHRLDITLSSKFGDGWRNSDGIDPLEPDADFVSRFNLYEKNSIKLNPHKFVLNDFNQTYTNQLSSVSDKYKNHHIVPKCLAGDRGLYIDASGILYPCSWMSHPYDLKLKPSQVNIWKEYRSRFDLNQRSLESILNDELWSSFQASWKNESDCYTTCDSKCRSSLPMTLKDF